MDNNKTDNDHTNKSATSANNAQIVVHLNPDLETVCEVVEEDIPSSSSSWRGLSEQSEDTYETATPYGATNCLEPEEKQTLESTMEDIELSSMVSQDEDDDEERNLKAIVSHNGEDPYEEEPAMIQEDLEKPTEEALLVMEEASSTTSTNKSGSETESSPSNHEDLEEVPETSTDVPTSSKESSDNNNNRKDKGLRCACLPNGAFQVLFAQFFLLIGLILSGWAMADCKFIEATAGYPDPFIPPTTSYYPPPYYYDKQAADPWWYDYYSYGTRPLQLGEAPPLIPEKRRGFGFVFNETLQGGCFAYSDNNRRYWYSEEFTSYFDFLGSDWNLPRILTGIGMAIGWMVFLATFWMYCCSCIKPIRWLAGTTVLLLVAGFQSSSFAVLGSSFCHEEDPEITNCEPARGFWMMLGGIFCYLITAGLFCSMKNYPGRVQS